MAGIGLVLSTPTSEDYQICSTIEERFGIKNLKSNLVNANVGRNIDEKLIYLNANIAILNNDYTCANAVFVTSYTPIEIIIDVLSLPINEVCERKEEFARLLINCYGVINRHFSTITLINGDAGIINGALSFYDPKTKLMEMVIAGLIADTKGLILCNKNILHTNFRSHDDVVESVIKIAIAVESKNMKEKEKAVIH